MKGRFTIIEFPVFCNYLVHVEVAKDLFKAMQQYPATRNVPLEDTQAITVHKDDDSHSFIFFRPNVDAGTIAHECYHVARRILKYMGCEVDNEAVAYHLGYLVNKVTRFVRRGKR